WLLGTAHRVQRPGAGLLPPERPPLGLGTFAAARRFTYAKGCRRAAQHSLREALREAMGGHRGRRRAGHRPAQERRREAGGRVRADAPRERNGGEPSPGGAQKLPGEIGQTIWREAAANPSTPRSPAPRPLRKGAGAWAG